MAISKKKLFLGALLVLVLAVVTLFFITNQLPKPSIASAAGKPAPEFTLKDQNGQDFTLASQRGHKVLLLFYRGYW